MRIKYFWCACALVWSSGWGGSVWGQGVNNRPLSLAVEQAVNSHPSVQSKLSAQIGTKADIQAAKYQYYPTTSVLTERGSSEISKSSGYSSSNTLRIQQPLWQGGRLDAGLSVAEYKNLLAQVSLAETQHSVALSTLDAWTALLTALGRKISAQRTYERLVRLNQMIQRRVAGDVSPPVDASLMSARLSQGQSDLLAATAAQESARKRLEQWAGDLLEGKGLTLHDAQLLKTLTESLEELPENFYAQMTQNIEQYVSLRRNSVETAVAQAEVRQKRADIWPQVFARVDRTRGETGTTFGQNYHYADTKVYFGLQFTPGAGLSTNEAIKSQISKVLVLQDDREALKRSLIQNANTDWRDHLANREKIKLAQAAMDSSEDIVDSYTRLFVAGRRSWLEVLNSVRELGQAEMTLTDLQAVQIAVLFRLRMYGGAWEWQNQ